MIALAEARAVHFGKGGPEIKENLFLPFGQGHWWLSAGGSYGFGACVVDK